MPPISFPRVIFTRINGRKITRVVVRDWVIMRTVRPDYPNVIWVRWTARAESQRDKNMTLEVLLSPLVSDPASSISPP